LESLLDTLGLSQSVQLLSLSPPGWGGNLLRGLANSLQIALGAYGFGLLIGLFGAYGKLYGGPILRDLLAIYTTVIRAVPELVLILILYYVGSDLINQAALAMGYGRVEISGVVAGIWVLGVVQGAYSTEVLRGAIQAIPPGQLEAARAFGMPRLTMFRRIWLPQAIRNVLPTLGGETILQLKATPLVATITVIEIYSVSSRVRSDTFIVYEPLLLLALVYIIIAGFIALAFKKIEDRVPDRPRRG
jgi:polar amino acid transport system permease protein